VALFGVLVPLAISYLAGFNSEKGFMSGQIQRNPEAKSAELRLYIFFTITLFLLSEVIAIVLVIKRQDLHLQPRIGAYLLPILAVMPLAAARVAYRRVVGYFAASQAGQALLAALQKSLAQMVVIVYAVVVCLLALISSRLYV
jgi:hypothetical protein